MLVYEISLLLILVLKLKNRISRNQYRKQSFASVQDRCRNLVLEGMLVYEISFLLILKLNSLNLGIRIENKVLLALTTASAILDHTSRLVRTRDGGWGNKAMGESAR